MEVVPRLLTVPKKISLKEKFKPTLAKEERNAISQRIPSIFTPPYEEISRLLDKQKFDKTEIEKTIQQTVNIFFYAGDSFALLDLTKKHIRLEIQTVKSPGVGTFIFCNNSNIFKLQVSFLEAKALHVVFLLN